jgi:MerR family transcriptional regulator, heat shock protein HspR
MSTPPRRTTSRHATRVQVSADRGVFMISVAAELAEMHPQTLRMYEARGLIEPKRSAKGTRLYSQADVERLRRIQEMTNELGLNLAGVERVLEMEEKLARALELHAQIARLEEVRERVGADIVLMRKGGDIVRASDARSPFKIPVRRDDGTPPH